MKKIVGILILILGVFFTGTVPAFAISGACSGHGGVNYSAGADYDGSVICGDGWRNSSVLSSDMGSNYRSGYPTSSYSTYSYTPIYTYPSYTTPSYSFPSYNDKYGTVVYASSSCDYYIVGVGSSYVLAEWFSGKMPSNGDSIHGNMYSFGFKDLYIGNSKTHAWIEDYLLSSSSVVEKYIDKCN